MSTKNDSFVFDTLVEGENFCNLKKERKALFQNIHDGKRTILFGRRNTGKTSMVRSFCIPEFKKSEKKSFVLFADLMNVLDLESIHRRINIALQEGFKDSFPVKSVINSASSLLKALRPTMSVDPVSGPSFSITSGENKVPDFRVVFDELRNIHKAVPTLIVLDEFQDIAKVPEAEALFRKCLQELPSDLPVIILGSKKHLLSRIFANPDSPLAGFGLGLEIPAIPYREYHEYISKRFEKYKIDMNLEVATFLQDELSRIPEAINVVCYFITRRFSNCVIEKKDVLDCIGECVESRRSLLEEYIGKFSISEQRILNAFARARFVQNVSGKEFISATQTSQSYIFKTVKKFLDDAVIYKMAEGYELADPLLRHYICRFH